MSILVAKKALPKSADKCSRPHNTLILSGMFFFFFLDGLLSRQVRQMFRFETMIMKSYNNIAFARVGAHLPIAHALRLLSTKELRFFFAQIF